MRVEAVQDTGSRSLPVVAARLDIVPPRSDLPQAVENEAGVLDVSPEPIVRPRRGEGARTLLVGSAGTAIVHAGFVGLFMLLVGWRDLVTRPERAITVELVSSMPKAADAPEVKPDAPPAPRPNPVSPPAPPPEAATTEMAPVPPSQGTPPETPKLVAPPPEAAPAAALAAPQPVPANTLPDKPTETPAPAAVAAHEAPRVLATRSGSFTVPQAAPVPDKADPAPAQQPAPVQKPDPDAQLRAALPMNTMAMPSSFRAVLSGGGIALSEQYRGLVFGRLGRARAAADRARAAGLRGQAMVTFTVAPDGAVSDLAVAQSSGSAALDRLALDMVREAAPFPPPPPGARRSFSPVLTFGGD